MLFSVGYNSSHKQEADEIRCPVNQLGLIYKSIEGKRVNIILNEPLSSKVFEQFDLVRKATDDNYTICVDKLSLLQPLKRDGYNVYSAFPVTDFETFDNLGSIGVTDILIDGPLGFACGDVVKGATGHGVKIRVCPWRSPNAALSSGPNAASFFIRPEDLSKYAPYFDVLDFQTSVAEKEDALFQIYKRGLYGFDLADLVDNLNVHVNNFCISDDFAYQRMDCKQICKVPGHRCRVCNTEFKFAQNAEKYIKGEEEHGNKKG